MPATPRTTPLTQFELETLNSTPTGPCDLVLNEKHFAQVVRDGMARAEVSLDIMTADFKAMLVPLASNRRGSGKARSIIDLFRKLAAKGVEIRLLHAGTPSGPALLELKKAAKAGALEAGAPGGGANLTIRRCPRLHAKAVVIDARMMYLGSANLTGAGLGAKAPHRRNFEMGIWTTAAPLIEGVLGQFNQLWEGHPCKTCQRRDFCPVPLEEPNL